MQDSEMPIAEPPPSGQRPQPGLFIVPKKTAPVREKFKTFTSNGMVVIQSEFTDQLEALTKAYVAEYKPATPTEITLVNDLATTRCRCDYVDRLKAQLGAVGGKEKLITTLLRYQETNQKQFERSLKMLRKVQKARRQEEARRPYLVKPKTVGEC